MQLHHIHIQVVGKDRKHMLHPRSTSHFNAVLASALISAFLLAFVGVTDARSVGAQQIPTLNVPGKQMVTVNNFTPRSMTFTGHVQLNLYNGETARALNQATAIGSCVACQSLAVAMQINLIGSLTTQVYATNNAIALNHSCSGCLTEADSLQFWIAVPQSTVTVPSNVQALMSQMNHEFAVLQQQPNLTPASAMSGVNGVLAQNASLLGYLTTRFAQTTSPGS
jgi:hypothetical protein